MNRVRPHEHYVARINRLIEQDRLAEARELADQYLAEGLAALSGQAVPAAPPPARRPGGLARSAAGLLRSTAQACAAQLSPLPVGATCASCGAVRRHRRGAWLCPRCDRA